MRPALTMRRKRLKSECPSNHGQTVMERLAALGAHPHRHLIGERPFQNGNGLRQGPGVIEVAPPAAHAEGPAVRRGRVPLQKVLPVGIVMPGIFAPASGHNPDNLQDGNGPVYPH